MAIDKNIQSRINWEKAVNFTPKAGEIIVYDPDESHANSRIKIGDGTTLVNDLKFNLDGYTTEGYVKNLFRSLSSDRVLRFYCVEDVTIVNNGVSTVYPANSNVEVKFLETDVFEIIPTSDNSILALNGFPGALGTYYSWLEGVK